jgi:signal transduction histidine kinase
MGLAICKKLVIQYGGTIWAEAEACKDIYFNLTMKIVINIKYLINSKSIL